MPKPYSFAFSYSRWSDWKKCPQMYKFKNVDKVDTGPTSPALLKGRKVHDDVAHYLEGKTDLPEVLAKHFSIVGQHIRELPKDRKAIEKQMAFDREAKPVSWFGKNAYTRFIWDALVLDAPRISEVTKASAIDWKTGKPYGSYDDQMQIFSIPAFWTYPNLEEFTGHLLYLDSGEDKDFTITRTQFYEHVQGTWVANIRMMEADVAYPPKPSRDACRFCDFNAKGKGMDKPWGVCQVGEA